MGEFDSRKVIMESVVGRIERLYELYRQHYLRLRSDVIAANQSLGSANPEKTWMTMLSRTEFEAILTAPADDSDMLKRWVRRLIRGHEHEFPELRVA